MRCCSTNNDGYCDPVLMHSYDGLAFSKVSLVQKLLSEIAWPGKGSVTHSVRTAFLSQKSSLVLYQIGKQFEICSGF